MKTILWFIPLLCASCTAWPTPDGYGVAVGGKGGYERSPNGAVRMIYDNEKSLQDAALAAVGIAGFAADKAATKAKETTAQVTSGHRSAETINASNNAASVAKEGIAADVTKTITIPK